MIERRAASPAGDGGIRLCFDRNPLSNRTGFVGLFSYPGYVFFQIICVWLVSGS